MNARILVVEDGDALRRGLAAALEESGAEVHTEADGAAAVALLGDPDVACYDVVVTDLRLPGADGFAVLEAARERDARSAVIVMTAYGSVENAVEAMRSGAFDFVQKPFELEQLEVRVSRALEHARLHREVGALRARLQARFGTQGIIGQSAALRAALDLARRVAPSRSTVLVTGETGTGKEVIAGLIHALSPRADGPFVKVNCAALPETLLESELFGHERGAFTGADRMRIGRFEQASGGTLFLDEIGDMTAATQAKLLRVLQDQEFHRLGGTRSLRTDARIVAATNQDLEGAIARAAFREDLYFRLNVIGIHLPPLRERPEDLLALAEHFLQEFARELGRPMMCFGPEAREALGRHGWPGNVRELRNAVERGVLMADGTRVSKLEVGSGAGGGETALGAWTPRLPPEGVSLREVEHQVVLAALRRVNFVQKDAARLLGVTRRKLNYMIRRMGITHPSWRRNRGGPAADAPTA
ncbi:MAG: sigma-54 dependent transcriptional regulator [Myxococcota bacterium]